MDKNYNGTLKKQLTRIIKNHAITIIMVIILGALTPLTFAPYYQFWLMPIIFACLIGIIEYNVSRALRLVYLFGLCAYIGQFYWIHTALHDISGLPNIFALPLTIMLPAFLALYPVCAFWLWRKFILPRWVSIGIMLPLLWGLTEFLRERLFTGLGWGALGYSQIAEYSPLSGYAAMGGIHLVTLLTAGVGAWLVLILGKEKNKIKVVFSFMIIIVLLMGTAIKHFDFTEPDGSSGKVALLQGNIPQTIKWDIGTLDSIISTYYTMVENTRADIQILPETALPVFRQDLPDEIFIAFTEAAKRNGGEAVLGIMNLSNDYENYYNSMIHYTLNKENRLKYSIYSKNHLVPFGEYKPLPWLTTWIYSFMNMPLSDIKKGGMNQKPLELANQKVAFNICYEDGFGDELIGSARQSSLIANSSNMTWFGGSNAMFQQLQQSQARAIELGRYVVRATNNGSTAIIDNKGKVIAQAEPNIQTVLVGDVKGYKGETVFMKIGSSWPLIIVEIFAALVLICYSKCYNRKLDI